MLVIPVLVQAFLAVSAVEAFDVGVLGGLPGSMKYSWTP